MKKSLIALLLGALLLAGCGSSKKVVTASEGFAYGEKGDVMRNAFFDFSVDDAKKADSYGELKPQEGKVFAVVTVTVTETQGKDVEMYDTDFQIQWGEGDEDFTYPVTFINEAKPNGNMLQAVYTIAGNGSLSGDLVFEVPADAEVLRLAYQEIFADESRKDIFFVDFSAK